MIDAIKVVDGATRNAFQRKVRDGLAVISSTYSDKEILDRMGKRFDQGWSFKEEVMTNDGKRLMEEGVPEIQDVIRWANEADEQLCDLGESVIKLSEKVGQKDGPTKEQMSKFEKTAVTIDSRGRGAKEMGARLVEFFVVETSGEEWTIEQRRYEGIGTYWTAYCSELATNEENGDIGAIDPRIYGKLRELENGALSGEQNAFDLLKALDELKEENRQYIEKIKGKISAEGRGGALVGAAIGAMAASKHE